MSELRKRLPEFFVKISPIGEVLAAAEGEQARLEAETAARNDQLTVSTADTGLMLWEQDYGLSSLGDLATRRGRVRAALTGGERPFTPEALRQLAITVGGAGAVSVEEDFANYRVVVTGAFADGSSIEALEEAIERFKPAHLQVALNPTTELTGTLKLYPVLSGAVFAELTGTLET